MAGDRHSNAPRALRDAQRGEEYLTGPGWEHWPAESNNEFTYRDEELEVPSPTETSTPRMFDQRECAMSEEIQTR